MAGTQSGQRRVDQAWQRFAAGDLDGAIAAVRPLASGNAPMAEGSAALGFFLLQAGRTDEAAAVLLPARERASGHAPLHWYTGYLLQRRGDAAAAAEAFLQACSLDESLDEAAYALAWVLHDLGRHREALEWADRALARAPHAAQRLLQAGWMAQAVGSFERAVQCYRQAIEVFGPDAPEQATLHVHLAQCLAHLGQRDDADQLLLRGFELWPQHPSLLAACAWRERERGNLHAGLRLARDLVNQQPAQASAWHLLGVLQQDLGDLDAADAAFARVQELDLRLVDALVRRAGIQRGRRQYAGARWLLELALREAPGDEGAQDLMVQVLLDLGETGSARRLLVRRLRARAHSADLWRLLGVAQARLGRPRAAWRSVDRALRVDWGSIEALRMRGWLAFEQQDFPAALDAVRRLLSRLPHDAAAHVQAAFVFSAAGRLEDAQARAEWAVAREPRESEGWRALSHVRFLQHRLEEAEFAINESLRLAPACVDSLRQLGWVLMGLGRHGQAQLAFLRVLDEAPQDSVARLELAQARLRSGDLAAASSDVEALLQARPQWPPALLLRARLLAEGPCTPAAAATAVQLCESLLRGNRLVSDCARVLLRLAAHGDAGARRALQALPPASLRTALRDAIAEGVHTHGQAHVDALVRIARDELPEDGWMATAALYAASLCARTTAQDLARQARDWYRSLKLRTGLTPLSLGDRPGRGQRRPRLAYVASQPHDSLLRRVLAAHDPQRVDVVLYTSSPTFDVPAHVRAIPLAPESLAESCAANAIDVVIDAGGLHPFDGQFGLLEQYARRVAPWQVGWLGCWGPSGGLFDALLTDREAVPVAQEPLYDEAIVCLEGGQWCWDPPAASPAVAPAPVLANGRVTFGVLARGLRLNPESVQAFARIVAATPEAEIRFIGRVADDWPQRSAIVSCMEANGVDAGRVYFDPWRPRAQLMEWFSRVDVVLDTFPGNGGLSLLDALWMGVPVVTQAGAWAGARQGCSVLRALGLGAWVGDDCTAFETIATRLGGDTHAIAGHRVALRGRLLASSLPDGRRVAAQIEAMCERWALELPVSPDAKDRKSQVRGHADRALDDWLMAPRRIALPAVAHTGAPELSVIVVLFNQAGLTRRTLQALADQQGVSFEAIVVDNASTDRTGELLERVSGARVVHNQDNRGFLLAANQGAGLARGRYLVFLNSDAILQRGALQAAWRALERDCSIGALGGRIVLTDGGLQEAGNALFRDGLAGGIGRGEDPFGHAVRAARATDYVSGVLLATPAALWRRLGGFDETFVPAYYEDSDYCMRVWQAGFRAWYEPSVLVEHLEWGSAAGDSATELMQRNRIAFLARHGDWLARQSRPCALPLDGDRWRSWQDRTHRRPRVLVLDNEVPHAFKGGGLPRARVMLQALADWPVTLLPLWVAEDSWKAVYETLPSTVEVALGCGLAGLESFLERRRGVYDVLLVSRPTNLQAIAPLRKRRPELFAGMRLVYDAEALFALRDIAMAAVRGRPLDRRKAAARVQAEVALAHGASDVLVVSQRDERYFKAAGCRTHVLGHSTRLRRPAPDSRQREGLLFVGALHPGTPNEDGLLWFLDEVMPLLHRRLGGFPEVRVVGVCGSSRVADRAGPHVRILGPQDELEPHYDAARVFIAPTRFAGGIPVKVIEAAAAGIPVAASAVLVRQLGWRDGLDIQGAKDAASFSAAVARLLRDDDLWRRQQEAAWTQCASRYDPDDFNRLLCEVLDPATGR